MPGACLLCQWFVKVLAESACASITKYHRPSNLPKKKKNQPEIHFPRFWRLEVQDQSASRFIAWQGPVPLSKKAI